MDDLGATSKLDGWYLWWEKGTLYRPQGPNGCYQMVVESTFAEAAKAASRQLNVPLSDLDCIRLHDCGVPLIMWSPSR
jgi:hypothetical protein